MLTKAEILRYIERVRDAYNELFEKVKEDTARFPSDEIPYFYAVMIIKNAFREFKPPEMEEDDG